MPMAIERKVPLPNFMLWVCGLKQYYKDCDTYDKLSDEYDNQNNYRELKKKYQDYK